MCPSKLARERKRMQTTKLNFLRISSLIISFVLLLVLASYCRLFAWSTRNSQEHCYYLFPCHVIYYILLLFYVMVRANKTNSYTTMINRIQYACSKRLVCVWIHFTAGMLVNIHVIAFPFRPSFALKSPSRTRKPIHEHPQLLLNLQLQLQLSLLALPTSVHMLGPSVPAIILAFCFSIVRKTFPLFFWRYFGYSLRATLSPHTPILHIPTTSTAITLKLCFSPLPR